MNNNIDNNIDDDRVIMFCVKCLTYIIVCIILTIGSCVMHVDYRVGKAIEGGTDPIAANLAMHDTMQSEKVLYNLTKTKN